MLVTDADVVAPVTAFSRYVTMCVGVTVSVCQHFKTKTTGHITTKLGKWIERDKSWSLISFEVKSLNIKVTVSCSLFRAVDANLLIVTTPYE